MFQINNKIFCRIMEVPNIQTINLDTYLRANPVMADVKFIFKDPESNEAREILAHKLILACASEVFQTQFYSDLNDEYVVIIEDSSYEAFKIFLEVLYNVKVDLKALSFQLLAKLSYLSEKYRVDVLKKEVNDILHMKTIDAHNLLIAVKVAIDNLRLEEFSNTLYTLCTSFVSKNPFTVMKLFAESEEEDCISCLRKVIARMFETREVENCVNCKTSPCLSGEYLTMENFVLDAKIIPEGFEDEDPPRLRRIIKMDQAQGMVHYSVSGNTGSISKLLVAQKYKFSC